MGKQIGLISDVHYHSDFDEQVEVGLKEFSDTMDDLGVENIYVLGDLILEENRKSDIEAFERVSDMLDTSAFDCTYLCGNHDLINVSRDEFLDIIDQERTYGVHDHKNGSIVYLDSVKQGYICSPSVTTSFDSVLRFCKTRGCGGSDRFESERDGSEVL